MNDTLKKFADFFDQQKWDYHPYDNRGMIRTWFTGKNGRWTCLAYGDDDLGVSAFLSMLPNNAPPDKRTKCAELLTRINWGLCQGNFEMDYEDGEIRFRMTTHAASTEHMENLVFGNLSTVDRFLPIIMKVLYAGVSPEVALKQEREKPEKKKKAKSPTETPRFELN